MTSPNEHLPTCEAGTEGCQVCGDVAPVARVLEIDVTARTALVAFNENTATVAMDFVDAGVGDDVLVQLGFAIARLQREVA
jgi:hydrogenase maturation factor